MTNNVFANGLEIACKAADGMSNAAFPDPCFTPPPPSGGWVLVPYANTAFAKDLTNGSTTVFISGLQVAKKDLSFIKTSTGNEPAAGPKGQKTGVKKGKAYFTSWSMDVKVEGKNVCRHTDSMTHNHASWPGNTSDWVYLDTASARGPCKKEFKKVKKKCKPTKKQGKGKKAKKVPDKSPGAWKKKYCKGLNFPPPPRDNATKKDIEKRLKDMADVSKWTAGMLQQAKDAALEKVKIWAAKKAGKLVAKSALKAWLGPIGWAWTAYDLVSTGLEVKEIYEKFNEMQKDIDKLRKLPGEIEALKKDGLSASDIADAQEILVKANPCLSAKRCLLVPATKTGAGKRSNQGCCAGQTPHHIIPKGQFKATDGEGAPNIDDCPGYNAGQAPTICAEGTSHSRGGSHEKIHDALEPKIVTAADAKGQLSYEESRDMSIDAARKVAPYCSKKCLRAQLDKYHKKACNQSGSLFKVRAASARSGKTYSNKPTETRRDEF
ncbi:MAG: hypothetical protein B6D77_15340 [gamma proteobacterium symbiont of Ctena orbiculata]|nr:MAG: hypothetical protein B6D77_15340 [gamma proteobacterium symbiont of Ctena orbiculata]PVV24069.1 MAG: hypothetical protein B6D78_02105 [gamma proteobacterium symbiont of Ctena orbiculata]